MKIKTLLAAAGMLTLVGTQASAITTVTFDGAVSLVFTGADVSVGDNFSTMLVFDETVSGVESVARSMTFTNAFLSISTSLNGVEIFSLASAPSVRNESELLDTAFGDVASLDLVDSVFDQNVRLADLTSVLLDAINVTDLGAGVQAMVDILNAGTISTGSNFRALVNFQGSGATRTANGFRVDLTSASLNAVPAPAALPLLASAVGLLVFAGWRRRKATTA